ncbi:hypothetical protein CRENBAI_015958 [Crenichthys baileyi]|uniref:Uncharacterized protein n=1 Tax=Crenichthys baileyi TaxID=28760 RepID=A0AAV9SCM0_9TELE
MPGYSPKQRSPMTLGGSPQRAAAPELGAVRENRGQASKRSPLPTAYNTEIHQISQDRRDYEVPGKCTQPRDTNCQPGHNPNPSNSLPTSDPIVSQPCHSQPNKPQPSQPLAYSSSQGHRKGTPHVAHRQPLHRESEKPPSRPDPAPNLVTPDRTGGHSGPRPNPISGLAAP